MFSKLKENLMMSAQGPPVNGSAKETSTDEDEMIWHVPKEIAEMPLGFVVDAGGSVTKLIFRSKKDYDHGKLKRECQDPSQGIIRLKYFALGDDQNVIDFIKRECDVMGNPGVGPHQVWLHTGFNTQFFKEKLDKEFDIRTVIHSEIHALMTCIADIFIHDRASQLKHFLPPSIPALENTLKLARSLLTGAQHMKEAGDDSYEQMANNTFLMDYRNTLMTTDAETWAQELGRENLEFPCMISYFGSANTAYVMFKDGKYIPCCLDPVAGKTFIALSLALTGAKDSEEFMEMAARGDSNKVDVLFKDLKTGSNGGSWYDALPGELVCYALGKMTRNNKFAGKYAKDDLAAAILQVHCAMFANMAVLNARCQNVRSVIITGSFVGPDLAREKMEQSFRLSCVTQLFYGLDHLINVHFLPNPGFLVALGVWFKNLDGRRQ